MHTRAFAVATMVVAASSAALADLEVPDFRGQPDAQFAGWESFTTPFGGVNLPDVAGSDLSATLTQETAGATITSGGNIYVPGGIAQFTFSAAAMNELTLVVFQMRISGLEMDYDNVVLRYRDANDEVQTLSGGYEELSRVSQGGFGATVESRYDFDLTGLGVTTFDVFAPGADIHISLDRAELDVLTIPAPGGLALLSGAVVAAVRRRRA